MKKEELNILQNEFVFGRLSGSAGNITAVSIEYNLVDMQSGFHWTNKKVLRTKVMSKDNTISERFEPVRAVSD